VIESLPMNVMKRSLPALLLVVWTGAISAKTPVLPSIVSRTARARAYSGFVPFYWDAREGRLLLEIHDFRRKFLFGSGLASGAGILDAFLDRGEPGELGLCRFQRVGPRVLLVQEQTTNRSGSSDAELTRVVTESFPTSVLASMPVVAQTGDAVLVDATEFLLRDRQVLPLLREANLKGWKQDASLSALNFERTGAFPRNSEIEAVLSFVCDDPPPSIAEVLPDGRTMSLRIHHTFLALPEPGYSPRALDPRVGFITNFYRDQTAPFTEPIERYQITRWRLDAAHPHILYYLDRGIPEPERSAIRDAVLWWNHAFRDAGFPDALEIRDLPVGATFLDARYSGVEWVNRAERGWSVGEIQIDPRTGEILHGVARIDSHRRRTTARIWKNLQPLGQGGFCSAGDGPDLSLLAGEMGVGEQALVLDRLEYLAAHEVGHTLGLMHNWAATTFGWGSVMDYLAPDIELRNGKFDLSNAYPHDIGPYDHLMIHWGYSSDSNPRALDAIVREAYARGIVYPLESDSRWAEYDYGSDPVEWLAVAQAVREKLLARFGVAQLSPGEPVHDLQKRFSLAYLYHRFAIQAAAQFLGGQFQTNALAGDGQAPVAWVEPERQRRALRLLVEALTPANLDVPDAVLTSLVPAPQATRETRERFSSDAGESFSILTAARSLSDFVVTRLLDPERDARLTIDFDAGAPGVDEVFNSLVDSTWGAAVPDGARRAALSRVARRSVLDGFRRLAASSEASPEVRAEAVATLEALGSQLHDARSGDPAEKAFLSLAARDIRDFFAHPGTSAPRKPEQAPPGRPIGGGNADIH
jgi:hypothetical protein